MCRFPGAHWLLYPPFLAGLLALIYLLSWVSSGASKTPRRRWTFDAAGVSSVVIASARANEARVVEGPSSRSVEISARPHRIPNGYHAREPEGREIPAAEWPFPWTVERTGGQLRLRCEGETRLQYCHYVLDEVEIRAPPGLKVLREGGAAAKGAAGAVSSKP